MRLLESVTFEDAVFVEEGGQKVIKGVVMLGPVSSHGYEYEQPAMAKAVSNGFYENVRIFINHGEGNRDLMRLAGVFKESRHEGGKVRGNAYLLDDPYGKKFWDIARPMPEAAGCSHVADGRLVTKNGKKVVEEITAVHSIDLVVKGATTRSVFEASDPANPPTVGNSSIPTPKTGEKKYQYIARCLRAVKDANGTITDTEAGAMRFAPGMPATKAWTPAQAKM